MENKTICPFCSNPMVSGKLILGVDVGALNAVLGFSIGSTGSLTWKADSGDRKITIRGKRKNIPAFHCKNCDSVVYKMP